MVSIAKKRKSIPEILKCKYGNLGRDQLFLLLVDW